MDVTHDEAVATLKYHKRMSLLVRDVGKVPHSCTAYDKDWDVCSPGWVFSSFFLFRIYKLFMITIVWCFIEAELHRPQENGLQPCKWWKKRHDVYYRDLNSPPFVTIQMNIQLDI